MNFLGRRILLTTLDPIPRPWRAVPGYFVINKQEREALARNDGETFKRLADIVGAEDAAEARGIGKYTKLKRPRGRTGPAVWLSTVAALLRMKHRR